jgi:hypothetical protein
VRAPEENNCPDGERRHRPGAPVHRHRQPNHGRDDDDHVPLKAMDNTIEFGDPDAYTPDFNAIVVGASAST